MVVVVLFLIVMPKFKIVQNQVDRLNLVSREIFNRTSGYSGFQYREA